MANKVPFPPLLPRPANLGAIGTIAQFIIGQAMALFNELSAHALRVNGSLPADGTEPMTGPLGLKHYATADLPAAASYEGHIVYDTTTNQVKASNGSSWSAL